MPVINLHTLPQFSDRMSWLYLEYGRVEKTDNGLIFRDKTGETPLPVAALSTLLMGPGTVITHRAAVAAAQMNCLLTWVGEGAIRLYASATGGSSQTRALYRQARIWADPVTKLAVVRKMYALRFEEDLAPDLDLNAIRGREGARVKAAYQDIARQSGVRWVRRQYDPKEWQAADLPNRCLSSATACLYGVVHAALTSAGYAPGLGFVHTGSPLSFVYDIADLYKMDLAVRIAFEVAAKPPPKNPEREVRKRCRDVFLKTNLLDRILPDVDEILTLDGDRHDRDEPDALPPELEGGTDPLDDRDPA
jgi:CRISPR-associated protein Cas1